MVEKAATIKSGGGGSGGDHWNSAASNPCSGVTLEELGKAIVDNAPPIPNHPSNDHKIGSTSFLPT